MTWLRCAEETATECPWCGSDKHPVMNIRAGSDMWRKLNPLSCPDCQGTGSLGMWQRVALAS